jgi:hypothetical protein
MDGSTQPISALLLKLKPLQFSEFVSPQIDEERKFDAVQPNSIHLLCDLVTDRYYSRFFLRSYL